MVYVEASGTLTTGHEDGSIVFWSADGKRYAAAVRWTYRDVECGAECGCAFLSLSLCASSHSSSRFLEHTNTVSCIIVASFFQRCYLLSSGYDGYAGATVCAASSNVV
jgi:hypothetical protein